MKKETKEVGRELHPGKGVSSQEGSLKKREVSKHQETLSLQSLWGALEAQSWQQECFLVFGKFSLFKTPFLGQDSFPRTELPHYPLCLFFHLLYFFYLF